MSGHYESAGAQRSHDGQAGAQHWRCRARPITNGRTRVAGRPCFLRTKRRQRLTHRGSVNMQKKLDLAEKALEVKSCWPL